MKKKILIFAGILVLLTVGTFLFQGPKDKWICKEGEWQRIGSPKVSQPQTPCKGQRKGPELPTIPPDSTVVSFYTWLQKNENTLTDETYKQSPYLADSYKQKISELLKSSADEDYNPFVCANEIPKKYKITKSSTNQTKATVIIEQTFETEKTFPIELQAVGKDWKITNIQCP